VLDIPVKLATGAVLF